mgnify:CR=1 FL=1|tara:strand:- start:27179 stop:27463 length:285 start_codon:yes stop_codon:yes gene_type:complete
MILTFNGGPWDGARLELEGNKTDVGYKLEWALRLREGSGDHMYESADVVLEDTATLVLEYRGCNPSDDAWAPGWTNREDDEGYYWDDEIDWGED